jgi:hypothetical protein
MSSILYIMYFIFVVIAEEFYKRYEEQGQVLDGNMGMGLGSPGGSPTNRRGRGGFDF